MARTKQQQTGTVELPTLGEEGDTCGECGSALATDQRYCLNCGWRRGGPGLDYEQRLANGSVAAAEGVAAAPALARGEWSPVAVIGSIAVLGVMLLLGVLIGKDDNKTTQVAAAPATTAPTATTATTAAAPTTTTPAKGAKGPKGAAAAAPGGGAAIKGGSGDAAGIPTASDLGTGQDYQNSLKKGGDKPVATNGPAVAQDPDAQPGNGSGAVSIGK